MNMQAKDEILTLAQAAVQLGVSQRTLMRFMGKGEIRGFMVGKRWKLMHSEIVDYIKRQQQKDPTYLDQQFAAIRVEGAKLADEFKEAMTQMGPEEKQAFIDGFFEMLGKSERGQQIIDRIDQEKQAKNHPGSRPTKTQPGHSEGKPDELLQRN